MVECPFVSDSYNDLRSLNHIQHNPAAMTYPYSTPSQRVSPYSSQHSPQLGYYDILQQQPSPGSPTRTSPSPTSPHIINNNNNDNNNTKVIMNGDHNAERPTVVSLSS